MDSSLLPPPDSAATSAAAPPPPADVETKRDEPEKEMVHKTKVIQFLGRTTPIILQNDNGPCPLLAICNVLSLKNSLNLSPDIPEVSQEKLLSLVAERLIDSNTNTDNKDTGYVENQLQNIADAIDLLPRLATGIDVNLKFRRIDDFEFTPECAIFDLLDIPLYHGWIVDPQDHETSGAISSKSYNTLMGELVSLETKKIEGGQKKGLEDESVDFVAATTAALGIPSPNLSRGQSFDDSPHKSRKGDIEEEAELIRALKLSEMDNSDLLADGVVADVDMKGSANVNISDEITHSETVEDNITAELLKTATVLSKDNDLGNLKVDLKLLSQEDVSSSSKPDLQNSCTQPSNEDSRKIVDSIISSDTWVENGKVQPVSFGQDFVAATTAALGIPSPNLSRGQSFDDSPHKSRKGDIKEEAEHLGAFVNKSEVITHLETVEENITTEVLKAATVPSNDNDLSNLKVDLKFPEVFSHEDVSSSSKPDLQNSCTQPSNEESRKIVDSIIGSDTWIKNGKVQPIFFGQDSASASDNSQYKSMSADHTRDHVATTSNPDDPKNHHYGCEAKGSSSLSNEAAVFGSSIGQMHCIDEPETISSSADDSEPIYEGEECILDSGTVVYENREPIYEGEVVLAEQVDTGYVDDGGLNSKDRISIEQGEIIRNFMKNSASQLTVYGLFSLQDQVKERELCVFFRNNHFNTMFKYEGELYILATDQGYINQPDLVWEKLNEVNGDTVYMTSNFKEFKMDDHSSSTWDEQNAVTSTADYLATIDSSQPNSSFNTDLQLAIALQQQEFDQQQQEQQREQQRQRSSHQPAVSGTSRLVTGPHSQVSRTSGKHTSSSKHESKSKEKCIVM